VYLAAGDLERIAGFLGVAVAEFEKRHVYRTRHRMRLRVARESPCGFLRADGCAIHAVKPTQCRIFPYWPELVDAAGEWRLAARYCPGIGQGELVPIEAARGEARRMREAYPGMYEEG
jgi:Fe-S-cluster containining protein